MATRKVSQPRRRGPAAYTAAQKKEIVEYARTHSISDAHDVYRTSTSAIARWMTEFPVSTVLTRDGAPKTPAAMLRRMADIKDTCGLLMSEYEELLKAVKK